MEAEWPGPVGGRFRGCGPERPQPRPGGAGAPQWRSGPPGRGVRGAACYRLRASFALIVLCEWSALLAFGVNFTVSVPESDFCLSLVVP